MPEQPYNPRHTCPVACPAIMVGFGLTIYRDDRIPIRFGRPPRVIPSTSEGVPTTHIMHEHSRIKRRGNSLQQTRAPPIRQPVGRGARPRQLFPSETVHASRGSRSRQLLHLASRASDAGGAVRSGSDVTVYLLGSAVFILAGFPQLPG